MQFGCQQPLLLGGALHDSLKKRLRGRLTFTENVEIPKLSEDVQETLEGPLTYEECKKLLETFQNDKAPRKTDLPSNFIVTLLKVSTKRTRKVNSPSHSKGE